ncbi:MAG: M15 family metallopeptidase, partial [Actinomycetota bacterium]|nr:M15 family metallopeptidase [Actinomycetota bacterium]
MITWLGAIPEAFAPTKTLADVVPSVRPKFEALLAYATSLGLKPVIRSAGRTCAEQNAMKAEGWSQAALCRSMHTLGHAVDLDVVPNNCASYTKLGAWWEKQGGVWGGRWTQFGPCGDQGHFQYGFDGAGAVPTSVCPEGLSLAECEKLRSDYLTKAMAVRTSGGGVLTAAAIILVGVGFVWATLGIKPGKKLFGNPKVDITNAVHQMWVYQQSIVHGTEQMQRQLRK